MGGFLRFAIFTVDEGLRLSFFAELVCTSREAQIRKKLSSLELSNLNPKIRIPEWIPNPILFFLFLKLLSEMQMLSENAIAEWKCNCWVNMQLLRGNGIVEWKLNYWEITSAMSVQIFWAKKHDMNLVYILFVTKMYRLWSRGRCFHRLRHYLT